MLEFSKNNAEAEEAFQNQEWIERECEALDKLNYCQLLSGEVQNATLREISHTVIRE